VSRKLDEHNNGALRPNGNKSRVSMYYGDKDLKYDGKFTHGESENNAARVHQVESGMREGCFVSTTRNCEIAEFFATSDSCGSRMDGYVYVIDEEKLDEFGVKAWEFKDAEHPEHFEVSLRAHDNGDLPIEVILEKYEVPGSG
jgi:hypothetical protein